MSPGSDDTFSRLDAWQFLASDDGAGLVSAALEAGEPSPSVVKRLRASWPPRAVAAGLELARAREKARVKFPGVDALWCDVSGVEQASSGLSADWKAARFERAGASEIADLCCGIGGDAMSLARIADVLAVDLDPVRAWMAARNASCRSAVDDIRSLELMPAHVHIDPARRDEGSGRRAWHPDAYQPSFSEILEVIARTRGAGCKLGPGIPLPLPGAPSESELEFLQEGNRLVQAVLWSGELAFAPGMRRATMLPSGESIVGQPVDVPPAPGEPEEGDYLLEPQPALERAGLVGHVVSSLPGAQGEAARGLGLLLSKEPVGTPWLIQWKIDAVLPLRERAVKAWLREHDGGELVARTRGRAIDVDRWAKTLRGDGARRHVLFGLRLGGTSRAIVAHPEG